MQKLLLKQSDLKMLRADLEKICKNYNIKIKYIVRKKQWLNFPFYFYSYYFYSYYFYNGVMSKKIKYYCAFILSEYKGDISFGEHVPGKKFIFYKFASFKNKKNILALVKKFFIKNHKRF